MPTTIDQKDELVRSLSRLGVGLIELVTSIRDEIVVLDRDGCVIAVMGELPDERRSESALGKTLREIVGRHAAAQHEAAHARALQNQHTAYEWTRGKGRDSLRLSTTAYPLRSARSIVGVVMITRRIASSARDQKHADVFVTQKAKRLLELEHGIQQLAGAIQNYRKTGQLPPEIDAASPLHHLSAREREVLNLLGQGYRPRSIAQNLHVSPETVRNHLKAMFKKTGTHSQEELTALLRVSNVF